MAGDSSAKHLDSYVPNTEIVSRKYAQLNEVSEETAIRYIKELSESTHLARTLLMCRPIWVVSMPVFSKRRTLRGQTMRAYIRKSIVGPDKNLSLKLQRQSPSNE